MLREAGGSVDDGLEGWAWIGVVDHLIPAGVGAGSRIEKSPSGVDERFGARGVETEIAGEAEVS